MVSKLFARMSAGRATRATAGARLGSGIMTAIITTTTLRGGSG